MLLIMTNLDIIMKIPPSHLVGLWTFRGLILILVALVVYNFIGADLSMIENSKTKTILAGSETYIQTIIEQDGDAGQASLTSWMQNRYEELTTTCN